MEGKAKSSGQQTPGASRRRASGARYRLVRFFPSLISLASLSDFYCIMQSNREAWQALLFSQIYCFSSYVSKNIQSHRTAQKIILANHVHWKLICRKIIWLNGYRAKNM
jgi:hypothetical protein